MLNRLARASAPLTSLIQLSTPTRAFRTTSIMATSRDSVIPQAERMFAGGTHKLDVWTIFTYVEQIAAFWW